MSTRPSPRRYVKRALALPRLGPRRMLEPGARLLPPILGRAASAGSSTRTSRRRASYAERAASGAASPWRGPAASGSPWPSSRCSSSTSSACASGARPWARPTSGASCRADLRRGRAEAAVAPPPPPPSPRPSPSRPSRRPGPSIESRRLAKPGRAFLDRRLGLDGDARLRPLGGAGGAASGAASRPRPTRRARPSPSWATTSLSWSSPAPRARGPCSPSQSSTRALPRPHCAASKAGSEALSEAGCADAVSAWLARDRGSWQAVLYTDGGLDLGGRALAAAFEDSGRGTLGSKVLGSSGSSLGVTGLRLEGGRRARQGPLHPLERLAWDQASEARA